MHGGLVSSFSKNSPNHPWCLCATRIKIFISDGKTNLKTPGLDVRNPWNATTGIHQNKKGIISPLCCCGVQVISRSHPLATSNLAWKTPRNSKGGRGILWSADTASCDHASICFSFQGWSWPPWNSWFASCSQLRKKKTLLVPWRISNQKSCLPSLVFLTSSRRVFECLSGPRQYATFYSEQGKFGDLFE